MKLRTLLAASLAALASSALVAIAQTPGVNNNFASVFTMVWEASSTKQTYSASVVQTLPATPTDVCSMTGSATKTIRVRRVIVSGVSNVVVSEPIAITRHGAYAALTDGQLMTKVKYDSQNGTSTLSFADYFTTAPSSLAIGTLTGVLADTYVTFPNTSTGIGNGAYTFEFGRFGSAVVLRGITQLLAVNMTGQDGGGKLSCTFEWTEE